MKTLTLLTATTALFLVAACEQVSKESIEQNALVYSLNLTLDEQNIWKTLTPAQQARAASFIENGGTLIASLGDK